MAIAASGAAAAALASCAPAQETHSASANVREPASGEGESNTSTSSIDVEGLMFYAGLKSSLYYRFAEMLAKHVEAAKDLKMTVLSSDGSKANVQAIADGIADFSLCQSDMAVFAYEGAEGFEEMRGEEISVVSVLYEEQLQIVTCNPDITSVSDLEGKRVSLGPINSGVYFDGIKILNACDMAETDVIPTYQSYGDAIESLKSDEIDAAFFFSGTPIEAVAETAEDQEAYLVPLDKSYVEKIVEMNPYLSPSVIAAQTYKGQSEPTATVACTAVLLASKETSADDVYTFVSDIYASIEDPAVVASYDKYQQLSVEKGASMGIVPYHPGAVRFFAEKGIAVS